MSLVALVSLALATASPPVTSPATMPAVDPPRAAHFHRGLTPVGTPERIVSLSPAVTETLFALGVGGKVVGVTRFCDRPAEARARPAVGGYVDASLEAILALAPGLVIAQPSFGQRQLLDRLHARGIPVFVVFADTVAENAQLLVALGGLFDRAPAAARLAEAQARAFAPAPSVTATRVVVVVGTEPLVVAGRGSFADDAVRAAGVTSAIADGDPAWPSWSLETLAARHVDVVVAAEGPLAVAGLERLLAPLGPRRPRVVAAPTAILMRPGPSLADDVTTLRGLLRAPPPGPTP